jgi:dTMP kinase
MVRRRIKQMRQRATAPARVAKPVLAARPWPGWFIAVEGGDGAGKSTQIAALAEWLRKRGFEVVATREPGGTELGHQLRDVLLHRSDLGGIGVRTEALLFAADRADHMEKVVMPALTRGAIVLTDRHVDSSIAYQSGGRGLPAEAVAALSTFATQGVRPDLILLLDLDPEVAGRRAAQRSVPYADQSSAQLSAQSWAQSSAQPSPQSVPEHSEGSAQPEPSARRSAGLDRLEAEPPAFHARVRAVFRDRAAADPGRYLVLDASEPAGVITAICQDRLAAFLPSSPREAAEEVERLRAIAEAEEAERAEQAARLAAAQAAAEAKAREAKAKALAAAQAEQAKRQVEITGLAEQAAAERAKAEAARAEAQRQVEADRAAAELRVAERSQQLAADAARRAEAEQVVRRAEARAKAQAREQAAADLAARAESEERTRKLVARATAIPASASTSAPEEPAAARSAGKSLADDLLGDGQSEPEQRSRRWRMRDDS